MKKQIGLPAGPLRRIEASRQGFTIVELSIYSGILIVFLFILTTAFAAVIDSHLSGQAASAVVADSRYLFSRFAYDMGRAQDIISPSVLGAQSSALTLTIGGVPHTYQVASGRLELTDGVGVSALNSFDTTVSNLSFRRYGNVGGKHSIRIQFTLTSLVSRNIGPETRSFQTTIGLR